MRFLLLPDLNIADAHDPNVSPPLPPRPDTQESASASDEEMMIQMPVLTASPSSSTLSQVSFQRVPAEDADAQVGELPPAQDGDAAVPLPELHASHSSAIVVSEAEEPAEEILLAAEEEEDAHKSVVSVFATDDS